MAGAYQPISRRRRATSALLSAAIVAVLLLALIWLAPHQPPRFGNGRTLSTFDVAPEAAPEHQRQQQQHRSASARPSAAAKVTPPPVPPPPVRPRNPVPAMPSDFIAMNLASTDITGLHAPADANGKGDEGKGDSVAAYGPGEGPGGVRLYNAEWYREPTDAELRTYEPRDLPVGAWGTIACRTVERFHVEDCRQLDESPVGVGLSRAMRQAAWQFLVRPPRVNGKPLVGSWVRIRIDITDRGSQPH